MDSEQGLDLDLMLFMSRKDRERKNLMISAFLYAIFIALTLNYCLFSSFITTGDQYWMNHGLKFEVINGRESPVDVIEKYFVGAGEPVEWWNWMEYTLSFLWSDNNLSTGKVLQPEERRYLSIHNKLIGSLRIRQLRVRNDSCVSMLEKHGVKFSDPFPHGSSKDFVNQCAGDFSESTLSTESFGVGKRFEYEPCESNGKTAVFYGYVNQYPCGGHVVTIPFSHSYMDAFAQLGQLKKDYFMDELTRAIFVEFYIYNGNLNYFVQIKNVIEMTPGGSTVPSWQFYIFKLEVLRTVGDYVSFGLCLLVPIFLLFYIYEWIHGAYLAFLDLKFQHKPWFQLFPFHYFLDLWNIIDFVKYCLFLSTFVCRLLWWNHPSRVTFLISEEKYPSLDEVATIWVVDTYICGILAGIVIIRSFKYFELSEDNNLLIRTIYLGFWKLMGTGFVLFYVLASFGWAFYMIYGFQIQSFKDYGLTLVTMFRGLLGDIDYEELKWADRKWAPVIQSLFMITSVFVVLNMFLAVIKDIFSTVTGEESIGEDSLIVEVASLGLNTVKKGYHALKQTIVDDEQGESIQRMNYESNHILDQGDSKLINSLAKFQEDHEGLDITHVHLKRTLGKNAPYSLLDRVGRRLDPKGEGTIDVMELSENISNERNVEIDEDSKRVIQEAIEFQKLSENIRKEESLKSIGIHYEQEEDLEDSQLSLKLDSLLERVNMLTKIINEK